MVATPVSHPTAAAIDSVSTACSGAKFFIAAPVHGAATHGIAVMLFFRADTPDGWGIPGIHGPLAEDELDGYVQSGVYLVRGSGENLLIDSGNWTIPEHHNGMGEFLVDLLDRESNDLKYIFITHFHYDHVGNA